MVSKKSGLLGGCVLVLLISGMGCANAQYNARSANGAAATVAMEETEECGEAGVEISPKTNRITIRPGEEPQVDILAALSINGHDDVGDEIDQLHAEDVDLRKEVKRLNGTLVDNSVADVDLRKEVKRLNGTLVDNSVADVDLRKEVKRLTGTLVDNSVADVDLRKEVKRLTDKNTALETTANATAAARDVEYQKKLAQRDTKIAELTGQIQTLDQRVLAMEALWKQSQNQGGQQSQGQ